MALGVIQVMGGYGYVGEYNVSRLWTVAKLLEIGEGTGKSHHKNMARDFLRFYMETNSSANKVAIRCVIIMALYNDDRLKMRKIMYSDEN